MLVRVDTIDVIVCFGLCCELLSKKHVAKYLWNTLDKQACVKQNIWKTTITWKSFSSKLHTGHHDDVTGKIHKSLKSEYTGQ